MMGRGRPVGSYKYDSGPVKRVQVTLDDATHEWLKGQEGGVSETICRLAAREAARELSRKERANQMMAAMTIPTAEEQEQGLIAAMNLPPHWTPDAKEQFVWHHAKRLCRERLWGDEAGWAAERDRLAKSL